MATTFLNLTIHPTSAWKASQLDAAHALADDVEIIDQAFPSVYPMASAAQVDAIADEMLADILLRFDPARLVVHLMGEMTLTCALVARLQSVGARVVASTTERVVNRVDDDSIARTFAFALFRDYPPLYVVASNTHRATDVLEMLEKPCA